MHGNRFDIMHFYFISFHIDFRYSLMISVSFPENAGLSERQEGCGLFSKSGWSDAVMQVTTNYFFRQD